MLYSLGYADDLADETEIAAAVEAAKGITRNGGRLHDRPPRRARPRDAGEEGGQGGWRTSARPADGILAP